MAAPTTIERREYKYLIDETTAAAVRAAIAPFCVLDPYASDSDLPGYTIDSLYLDTADLRLFRGTSDEWLDRFKLRIRTYPDRAGSPVFFEVKRRYNDVIHKTRGRVAGDQWQAAFSDPWAAVPPSAAPRSAVERFLYMAHTVDARPRTVVRYHRVPYASTIDDYARVTFDRDVRCSRAEAFAFHDSDHGWRNVDNPQAAKTNGSPVILELKFTRQVPSWMVAIVRRFELSRRAFSKYGTSVLAWYGVVDARTFAAGN